MRLKVAGRRVAGCWSPAFRLSGRVPDKLKLELQPRSARHLPSHPAVGCISTLFLKQDDALVSWKWVSLSPPCLCEPEFRPGRSPEFVDAPGLHSPQAARTGAALRWSSSNSCRSGPDLIRVSSQHKAESTSTSTHPKNTMNTSHPLRPASAWTSPNAPSI